MRVSREHLFPERCRRGFLRSGVHVRSVCNCICSRTYFVHVFSVITLPCWNIFALLTPVSSVGFYSLYSVCNFCFVVTIFSRWTTHGNSFLVVCVWRWLDNWNVFWFIAILKKPLCCVLFSSFVVNLCHHLIVRTRRLFSRLWSYAFDRLWYFPRLTSRNLCHCKYVAPQFCFVYGKPAMLYGW